jgi:hypothetical protein
MVDKGQEVANVVESDEIGPYTGEGWDSFQHEVSGADFTKGDLLVGVPFGLVEIVIRNGDYRHGRFDKEGTLIDGTGCGKTHPYAYMRAVIGPENELQKAVARGRLTEEASKLIDPGEQLGWIEAGTGVYRNILAYLESQGYIEFPEGPSLGAFGESKYDSLPAQWGFNKGDLRFGPDGEPVYTANLRLRFPRGLRVSEYTNDYTKEGRTRYPA